jgi:hypothetical protein
VLRVERSAEIGRVDAHGLQIGHDPRAHNAAAGEGAVVVRLQDPESNELLHPLGRRPAPAGELLGRDPIDAGDGTGNEGVQARVGAEPAALAVVNRASSGIIGVDPHAADRIRHHRHRRFSMQVGQHTGRRGGGRHAGCGREGR